MGNEFLGVFICTFHAYLSHQEFEQCFCGLDLLDISMRPLLHRAVAEQGRYQPTVVESLSTEQEPEHPNPKS